MSLESAPYYWLECDGCGERCEYGDFSAWADQAFAVDWALDADWTTDGAKHHCAKCPALTNCDECGKPAEAGAADRDGLCVACDAEVQKDAPNPAVIP